MTESEKQQQMIDELDKRREAEEQKETRREQRLARKRQKEKAEKEQKERDKQAEINPIGILNIKGSPLVQQAIAQEAQ